MPMPGVSDLHVNAPLTNVSVAYIQNPNRFIASRVFPRVPVEKRSDVYWRYSKSDWRRTEAAKRAPGTESKGTGWNNDTDTYYCDVYAVHKDIEDQVRANADSQFKLDSDATRFVTNQLLLRRDMDWVATYFQTGIWATEYDGVTATPTAGQFIQWDQEASDPLMDVTSWEIDFDLLTGFEINTMVIGANVWKRLKNHPAILDRIKYTQKGAVTKELVASFFEIPAGRLFVASASTSVGPQINDAALQDAQATMEYIVPANSAALFYVPSGPSLNEPSAGYVMTWKGYIGRNTEGVAISNFRMQHLKSDRIEGEMAYDMKVVSQDCGVFLNDVVAG